MTDELVFFLLELAGDLVTTYSLISMVIHVRRNSSLVTILRARPSISVRDCEWFIEIFAGKGGT